MIDYLIYDLNKQIWINLEFYFESYEFSNFHRFLKNFSEFILELFGFLKIKDIKKSTFYCTLTWQLTRQRSDVSSHGDVYTRHVAHVCARVCTRVRVCACASVISGLSIH